MLKFIKYLLYSVLALSVVTAFTFIVIAYLNLRVVSGPGGEYYLNASDSHSPLSTSERIVLYDKAVQLEPDNSLFIFGRGTAYFYSKNFKEALPDLARSSEMIDGVEKSRRLFIKALCEGELHLYTEAAHDFEQAINLLVGDGGAFAAQLYGGLALTQLATNEFETALRTAETAIRLDPRAPHWKYIKAMGIACSGDTPQAETILNNTAVHQTSTPAEGEQNQIFFDGNKEIARIDKCSREVISKHWDQGDRWRLDTGIDADYKRSN